MVSIDEHQEPDNKDLLDQIKECFIFQRRWQLVSMAAYIVTTVGTLLCSTSATLLAAAKYADQAAIMAGLATILIGVEKFLLFREKWRLHLTIATRLRVLESRIQFTKMTKDQIIRQFSETLSLYAEALPIAPRDN
jgi:hypothetical protein